jgi:hypothetical protein
MQLHCAAEQLQEQEILVAGVWLLQLEMLAVYLIL